LGHTRDAVTTSAPRSPAGRMLALGVHGVEPVAQLVVVAWEVELHRRASGRLITLQPSHNSAGIPNLPRRAAIGQAAVIGAGALGGAG
jgi:hypothetical protein